MKEELFNLKPIRKFIKGVGEKIEKYFGKKPGAIIALEDDGIFYGKALFEWLKKRGKKDLTLIFMDHNGKGMEKEKLKGRKVLVVDNDIITGQSYRQVMKILKKEKQRLDIKDVKYAVLCDRKGLADFSVEGYPPPFSFEKKKLDNIDLKILSDLSKDGRKSFVKIGKEIGISSVGVKKRVDKMVKAEIFQVRAVLNIRKFFKASALIGIDADPKTIQRLIKKFKKCPLVYNLVKLSGHHNLSLNIVAPDAKRIEIFVDKQIRSDPNVRYLEVDIGDVPIVPEYFSLPIYEKRKRICPCGEKCNECEYKAQCQCCLLSSWYKGPIL